MPNVTCDDAGSSVVQVIVAEVDLGVTVTELITGGVVIGGVGGGVRPGSGREHGVGHALDITGGGGDRDCRRG